MIYNDTIIELNENLSFTETGAYQDSWGSGSSQGWVHIQFDSDSMHYEYFQYQGLGSQKGIEFHIPKTE